MKLITLALIIFLSGCMNDPHSHPKERQGLIDGVRHKAATQIQKKTNLHLIGTGGEALHQIKTLMLAFNCYKELTIEESRELILIATNELITAVNQEERIRPYLNNYPFTPKNIQIFIFLRHPDRSNPDPGQLAIAGINRGMLYYETTDLQTKDLIKILEENYETAVLELNKTTKKSA